MGADDEVNTGGDQLPIIGILLFDDMGVDSQSGSSKPNITPAPAFPPSDSLVCCSLHLLVVVTTPLPSQALHL